MDITIPITTDSKILVFDIDGCVFDSEHRLHHFLEGRMDEYDSAHVHDVPIPQGVATYTALVYSLPGCIPIFVTARGERARDYTTKQLLAQFDFSFYLLMRPDGDITHDMLLKPRLLAEVGVQPKDIFLVFEDRASMVREWRRLGVVCYQTATGDF